jgi:outer membrane lipoprotein-sorting protein
MDLRRRARLAAALLLGAVLVAPPGSRASAVDSDESAAEIVDRVDRLLRGNSSVGSMTMEIQAAHWKRTLETRVWSKGTDRALVLVRKPAKEAGTATLKAEENIWNYLPKVERVIKIPSSMMMGSWMGSHFTNDDLVKDSRMIRDYTITVAFAGERDGETIWEFQLLPRPAAAVVWGKILLEVRQRDLMPLRQRYYDEDGALARTMTFADFREMGGRLIPTEMEMRPSNHPQEFTRVRYEDLRFDVALDDSFFSLRRLRNLSEEIQ